MVSIVDLRDSDGDRIDQIAEFLYKCFRKYAPEWLSDLESCKEEVQESFEPGRRSRVLIDGDGQALAWVSTIIDDNVWEIHPIAVSPKEQRKGYGAMLINDVAQLARAGGAVAMWAGTSDETGSTSFSDIDLYKNPASALDNFDAPPDHAINFWVKAGFSIVGVMPDEEGLGKPGIHFAKRLVDDSARLPVDRE